MKTFYDAIITAATLTASDIVGSRVLDATVFAEADDNAATYNTTANDLSGRTRTSASVEWDAASTTNGLNTSPSIITVIQEVVNRSGWVKGNAISIVLQINANNTCVSNSFDSNPTKAFKLNVTYTMRRVAEIIWF